ncbi:hypothetical protein [Halosegnis marinus]|uniref:hypothetical protein n=1 Tax=Halosegnis marinus TaxID=3034023 RepID=UPI0036098EFA
MTCRDPEATGSVVARLDAADATLLDVDGRGGSLEQLFLTLTDDERETTGRPVMAQEAVE